MLACFGLDDSKTFILDMRSPGQPVAELLGHQAPLGAISWGAGGPEGSGGGWIASCGELWHILVVGELTRQATTVNYSSTTCPRHYPHLEANLGQLPKAPVRLMRSPHPPHRMSTGHLHLPLEPSRYYLPKHGVQRERLITSRLLIAEIGLELSQGKSCPFCKYDPMAEENHLEPLDVRRVSESVF